MLATLFFAGAPFSAAPSVSNPDSPRSSALTEAPAWTFDLIPYVWVASIHGSLAVDGQEVDVEDGGDGFFGDPALGGFLGHFEAGRGPWSFVLAPIFISADMEGSQPPSTDGDISIHAQVHEAFVAREFAAGWQWMAGLRYQKLETDLDLSSGGAQLSSQDSSKTWTDPIVGLRYHAHFAESWSVNGRADIGGFGVGSDFVWNASLVAGYQISALCAVHLGYRALSFDFEDKGGSERLAYDLSMYGPIIGVSFSF
jgi:hypothetical protein